MRLIWLVLVAVSCDGGGKSSGDDDDDTSVVGDDDDDGPCDDPAFTDADGDGYGDPNSPVCGKGPDSVRNDDDCDDTDADVNPDGIDEPYDGIDSNCDFASDYDVDGDGHDAEEFGGDDCRDGAPLIYGDRCDHVLASVGEQIIEFNGGGAEVQAWTVSHPDDGSDPELRGVAIDDAGRFHVHNGGDNVWNEAVLSTYDESTSSWSHIPYSNWNTGSVLSAGGLTTDGQKVWGCNVNNAVLEFDIAAGQAAPWGGTEDPLDVHYDDGNLYVIYDDIHIFDAASRTSQGLVNMTTAADPRGVHVHAGEVWTADWNGKIVIYDDQGFLQNELNTGVNQLMDIDIDSTGLIAVGANNGKMLLLDTNLGLPIVIDRGGFSGVFVARFRN